MHGDSLLSVAFYLYPKVAKGRGRDQEETARQHAKPQGEKRQAKRGAQDSKAKGNRADKAEISLRDSGGSLGRMDLATHSGR